MQNNNLISNIQHVFDREILDTLYNVLLYKILKTEQ